MFGHISMAESWEYHRPYVGKISILNVKMSQLSSDKWWSFRLLSIFPGWIKTENGSRIITIMEFRASWFSENSDRGIAISVSILSSGFSDALFVCFWWLVTLERLLAICIRTFLILQVLNLKPPTWTSRMRIFWLWSEFSDCYPKKCKSEFSDCDQDFLIVIRIFWLWSEFSDYDQKFLIVIRIFWLWSEFSDCDHNFLIVIRIFWLWSEFSDCDQNFLIVIIIFWLWS